MIKQKANELVFNAPYKFSLAVCKKNIAEVLTEAGLIEHPFPALVDPKSAEGYALYVYGDFNVGIKVPECTGNTPSFMLAPGLVDVYISSSLTVEDVHDHLNRIKCMVNGTICDVISPRR